MQNIILHIGHPKCGSTTIQNFLHANQVLLSKQGFGIADKRLKLMSRRSSKLAPVRYLTNIRNNYPKSQTKFTDAIRNLLTLNEKAGHHSLVISAENLTHPEFPELFSGFISDEINIKVIYYIRRQDDWLVSSWKQWQSKEGSKLSQIVQNHIANPKDLYRTIIANWSNVCGRENMHVGLVHPDYLTNGALIDDFIAQIGLKKNISYTNTDDANLSLNHHLVHGLSYSPYLFNGPHDSTLTNFLQTEFGASLSISNDDPLSVKERQAILATHAEENAWLEAEFFKEQGLENWLKIRPKHPHKAPNDIEALLQMQGITLKLLSDLLSR